MPQNDSQVEDAIDFLMGLGVKRERIAVGTLHRQAPGRVKRWFGVPMRLGQVASRR